MHRQAAERPRSADLSRLRLFIRAAHVRQIEGQIILFAKHLSSSLHKTALNLVIDPSTGWTSLKRVRTSLRPVLGYLPVRQIWSRCCHWRKSPRNPRLYAIWNVQLSMRLGVVGPEKVKVFVESKNRRGSQKRRTTASICEIPCCSNQHQIELIALEAFHCSNRKSWNSSPKSSPATSN